MVDHASGRTDDDIGTRAQLRLLLLHTQSSYNEARAHVRELREGVDNAVSLDGQLACWR
jgi:hypothetical protein